MTILTRFPARIRFVNPDGTLTLEAARLLDTIIGRVGDEMGDAGADVFAVPEPTASSSLPDVFQQQPADQFGEMVQQTAPEAVPVEMVQQHADYGAGTALVLSNYRFSLKDTAVTPGVYGSTTSIPTITVDQQGRITNVTNTPITGATYSGSLTGKTVVISNGIITSVT